MKQPLNFTSRCELTAAVDKPTKVEGLLYAGGMMRVPGWGDVVIDITGMSVPSTLTLLVDHVNEIGAVAGSATVIKTTKLVTIKGTLTSSPAGLAVANLLKDGVALQMSVGVDPEKTRFVQAGEEVQVNGRSITAPASGFTFIERCALREGTITPLGADDNTNIKIAAMRGGRQGSKMDFHEWLQAGGFDTTALTDTQRDTLKASFDLEQSEGGTRTSLKAHADLQRAEARSAVFRKWEVMNPDKAPEFLELFHCSNEGLGWSPDRLNLECSRAAKLQVDTRPRGIAPVRSGRRGDNNGRRHNSDLIAAHVLLRAGLGVKTLEKMCDPRVLQQAEDQRIHNLVDLCELALSMDGVEIPHSRSEMIRASLSTYSMPIGLGDGARKIAQASYLETPKTWEHFCKKQNVSDFKKTNLIRTIWGGNFERVAKGGEIKHGKMSEEVSSVKAETEGMLLSIDRTDIVNDDLGIFTGNSEALGRAGARVISDRVYEVLLANLEPDGATSFYTTGRGNLIEGGDTALSITALEEAIAAMIARKDSEGRNIDITPRTLLVAPENLATANRVINSSLVARDTSGGNDNLPQGNSLLNMVTPVCEPRLSNSLYSGSSALAYYLFSAPRDGSVTIGFLEGREGCQVEQMPDAPNRLAIIFRGIIDFGVSLSDWRGTTKIKGEA